MPYFVVLEFPELHNRRWTNFGTKECFDREYKKLQLTKIVAEGISQEEAMRLCEASETMIKNVTRRHTTNNP